MAGIVRVQLNGNLVADPEIRFTPSGAAVANFRVACTERTRDQQTNQWKDGDTTFLTVIGWRALAENIAETLKKGTGVTVSGILRQRSYETREGEKRTVYEVHEPIVGVDLQFQSAAVTRNSGNGGDHGARTPSVPAPHSAPGNPPVPTAAPSGGPSFLDEPPF